MALSPVVSEIFNVEKYRDLEIPVKGYSRSLEPTEIDPPPMTSFNVPQQPWAYLLPFSR